DFAGLGVNKVLQHLLRVGQGYVGPDQRRVRHQPNERAFQLTDVGANVGGDVQSHVGREGDFFLVSLLLKDGDLSFQVWRLNVGDQSPFKAAAQAVFDFRQFLGRAVAGYDDLLHGLMQGVESMEEFFLGTLFLRQKLDVVNQQDVHATKTVAE